MMEEINVYKLRFNVISFNIAKCQVSQSTENINEVAIKIIPNETHHPISAEFG